MSTTWSRRGLFGLGAAGAGAAMVGWPASPAGAAPPDGVIGTATDAPATNAVTALPGATVLGLSFLEFLPLEFGGGATVMGYSTAGRYLTPLGFLTAAIDLPVGATLLQVEGFGAVAAGTQVWGVGVVEVPATTTDGSLALSDMAVGQFSVVLTPPPGTVAAPGQRYFVQVSTNADQYVRGAIVQYLPPAARPLTTIEPARVYDSRLAGGKLGNGEERTVSVATALEGGDLVPDGATGVALTLTVTLTEGEFGGFVAAFPAGVAWPGTSSINWSGPNQNLATSAIVALGGDRQITLRGGVAPTDVIVDVTAYLA